MNKAFKNICALLACEFLACTDDKVTLTTAQLDTLEADMTNKEKRITDLTTQVNTLTETNTSLKEKSENLFSIDPRLRSQTLFMYCSQDFVDKYNEGAINWQTSLRVV